MNKMKNPNAEALVNCSIGNCSLTIRKSQKLFSSVNLSNFFQGVSINIYLPPKSKEVISFEML